MDFDRRLSIASQAVGALTVQTFDHEHVRENELTSFDTALLRWQGNICNGGSRSDRMDPEKVDYVVTDCAADTLKLGGRVEAAAVKRRVVV